MGYADRTKTYNVFCSNCGVPLQRNTITAKPAKCIACKLEYMKKYLLKYRKSHKS